MPTFAEAGVGEAELLSWTGLFAPTGTPGPVIEKVSTATLEFLATPEAARHFAQRGTMAFPGAGGEFATFVRADQEKWKKYIAAAGIQPE